MDNSKKSFFSKFNSIKTRVMALALVSVVITFLAIELTMLINTRSALSSVNSNYLLDIAKLTGKMLDEEIADQGLGVATTYENLSSIFADVGIKGVDSSYVYVVSKDGTMLYHPTESKVGSPVTNEVVAGVAAKLQAGQKVTPQFVQYIFNGASKYAAYFVTSDSETIVVATADETDIMSVQSKLIAIATTVGIIILVVAVLSSFILTSSFVKPIETMTKVINKTSDLDFSYDEEVEKLLKRGDETGRMATAVKRLEAQMGTVIGSLKDQASTLKDAAKELNNSCQETASTIEQVEKAVSEIAQGATSQAQETQRATENVIVMGNMVEETNKEVERLSDTAKDMKKSGDNATGILKELEVINEKAKESINVISEQTETTNNSANRIREATAIITSIAEETNLLSLNASIEAARAGDAGRGFAVVASQISKLAEQSNESARSIEEIIESLIADSEKSVETMNEVQAIMKEQSEKVEKTVEIFGQVKEGINTSIDGVSNIADKTKKLDEARISVVDVVQNLTAIAEENAASTEETSASVTEVTSIVSDVSSNANTLDNVADELSGNVDKFTV